MKLNLKIWMIMILIGISSCKRDRIPEGFTEDDHYYSVSQFLNDQWKNKGHLPYVLTKIEKKEGKVDSSFVNWTDTFFNEMRKPFDKSDISNQKFLGKYNFSVSRDEMAGWDVIMYEANDNDLYTQKLMITMDNLNNRVLSIFVETLKDGFLKDETQKLTYIPDRSIQMVDYEKSKLGKAHQVVTTYMFY